MTEAEGIRYVWLHSTQVPEPENVEAFLELMDDPANHPVLVHCEHGVGRTGVMSALFRMEYEGWSAAAAIEEARRYAHFGSFGEGQDKRVFLEGYVPRARRPASAP